MNKGILTIMTRFTAALTVGALALTGCSQPPDPGVSNTGDEGVVKVDDYYRDLQEHLGLTYQDLVMIDIQSLEFSRWQTEHSTTDLADSLSEHREKYGDQLRFILDNPAMIDAVLPSLKGIRYGALSVWPKDGILPDEVFVDFTRETVLFGESVIVNHLQESFLSASTEDLNALESTLDIQLHAWDVDGFSYGQSDRDLGVNRWTVAVVLDSYELYRFEGSGTSGPDGFIAVYDAFWAVANGHQ